MRARTASDAAWLVAVPCGLIVLAAIVLLTTPVRELLYPSRPPIRLLPEDANRLRPEPLEGTHYLIALTLPLLLTLATVAVARRIPPRDASERLRTAGVVGAQIVVLGLVVVCFAGQHAERWRSAYFSLPTLATALLFATVMLLVLPRVRSRLPAWHVGRTRTLRIALGTVALVAAAAWLLPGVNSEQSITWSQMEHDMAFHYDETFAVLNGLTPLADFNAQYASLFLYPLALSLLIFGDTLLAYTLTVSALSALALMAVYGVLRRAAGSALVALLLFLPFVATTMFNPERLWYAPFSAAIYFPMYPFRYAGPCLLAWLVARHLGRPGQAHVWLLFLAGGLVVLNNFEFGLPAFAATLAALLATTVDYRRHGLLRLAASVGVGVGAALAAVAALTLLRAGSLPDLGTIARYSRLYGVSGYSATRMPGVVGLPLVIFITYLAAIATAVVRRLDGAPNRVLTGMLAWSGVFGLGAGSYYVTRSVWSMMVLMFSAWALALALLTLAVLERPSGARARRAGLPALAVLFGFGLTVCSIAQLPSPWRELSRVQRPPLGIVPARISWSEAPSPDPVSRDFVASAPGPDGTFATRPGTPIALFETTGHRIADAYGVVNVVPFTGPESMHTLGDFERALDVLRDAGGSTVLLERARVSNLHRVLERRGFRILTHTGLRPTPVEAGLVPPDAVVVNELTKWVDTRALARG
ncbi:MAG TPA: hypothetical protein VFS37_15995 [Conexibacter sp.]|nr:hypothetical protein [Conexibacter sp.]